MSSQFKAVIFDLDGLLIDSEALWTEARNTAIKPFGASITAEFKKNIMGRDYEDGLQYIIDHFNLALTIDEFEKEEKAALEKIYQKRLKFMPGAEELLQEIGKTEIKKAITTGSDRRLLNLVKKVLQIGQFDVEITNDQIENGKPAPDIFLKAAENLSVGFQNCLVLEDSKFGIKGAKAAGMRAVAVVDKRFSNDADFTGEYEPDLIVYSLKDLNVDKLKRLFT